MQTFGQIGKKRIRWSYGKLQRACNNSCLPGAFLVVGTYVVAHGTSAWASADLLLSLFHQDPNDMTEPTSVQARLR